MKYAIIRSGGKQYKAVPGEKIQVDKLPVDPGKKVVLDEVLFIADGVKKVTIGTPLIKGAKVETTVADQIKGPKIRVFKYKPKVRYRRRQGHRQKYTLLNVDEIVAGTEKASTKASSTKAPSTAKTSTPKASATKASAAKTSTKKAASTKKPSTAKASSTKATSTKKAASSPKKSTPKGKAASSKKTSTTKAKTSKKAGDKDGS